MHAVQEQLDKINSQRESLLKRMRALKSGEFDETASSSATPRSKAGGVPRSSRSSRSRARAPSPSSPSEDNSGSEDQDTIFIKVYACFFLQIVKYKSTLLIEL